MSKPTQLHQALIHHNTGHPGREKGPLKLVDVLPGLEVCVLYLVFRQMMIFQHPGRETKGSPGGTPHQLRKRPLVRSLGPRYQLSLIGGCPHSVALHDSLHPFQQRVRFKNADRASTGLLQSKGRRC